MSLWTSAALGCLAVAVGSYLLGSISWAVIISKVFFHQDVRNFGSGNAGMTNVLRTFGKGAAALVTLGDFSKSIVTVLLSRVAFAHLFGALPFDVGYIAGICTMLGHMFPLYFGFKGGKGVLTALGMIFIIDWRVFLIVLGLGLILLFTTRIMSVASIFGALAYPFVSYAVDKVELGAVSPVDLACSVLIGLIIIYMHRVNIKRLLNGTEYKFGKPK